MSAAVIAGSAVLQMVLNDSEYMKAVDNVVEETRKKLQKISLAATAAGMSITGALGVAVQKSAANAGEIREFETGFKDADFAATNLAKTISKNLVTSMTQVQKEMASFVTISRDIGLVRSRTAEFSAAAADAGKRLEQIHRLGTGEGSKAVRAALEGNTEALKEFNITVTEHELAEAAAARGIQETVSQFTQLQRTLLTLDVIQKQVANQDTIGARDQGLIAYKSSVDRLGKSFSDLIDTVGTQVRPGFTAVYNITSGLAETLNGLINRFPVMSTVLASTGVVLTAVGGTMTALTSTVALGIIQWKINSYVIGLAKKSLMSFDATAKVVTWSTAMLTKGVTGLVGALKAIPTFGTIARVAITGVTAVMSVGLTPVLGIVAGLSAFGYAAYKLQTATGFLNPILETINGTFILLKESIFNAMKALSEFFGLTGSGGSGSGKSLMDRIFGGMSEEERAKKEYEEALNQTASNLKDSIKTPQQKYQEFMEDLAKIPEKLIDPAQRRQLIANAQQEMQDALRSDYESSDAGKIALARIQFAESLTEEVKTVEELQTEKMLKIQETLRSGNLSIEAARRGMEEARKTIQEERDKIVKEEQDRFKAARDVQLKSINEQFDRQLRIVKALSGDGAKQTQLELLQRQVDELRASGFSKEGTDKSIELAAQVIQRAEETVKKLRDAQDQAKLVTQSGIEAALGIGAKSLDDKMFEEARKQTQEAEKMREVMEQLYYEIRD